MHILKKFKKYLRGGSLRELRQETCWIYRHTRAYKKAIFAYTLLGVLTMALSLFAALLSKWLTNYIITQQGWHVLRYGILYVLFGIFSIIVNAFVSRYSAKIDLRISNTLRAEVFGVFMNTDWESLQAYHSGDLLSRINTDVNTVAGSVLGWIPTLLIKLTQFIASLAIIVYYDPTMALVVLFAAPFSLFIAGPFFRKMRSYSKQIRDVNSRMMSFQEETLQNVQSIKAFNLVNTFRSRLDEIQALYYNKSVEFNRFSVLNSSLFSATSMILSCLCLGWGAFRLWEGQIEDFGTMVLFIQLAGYLSSALTALIKLVPSAIECTVSAQRIMAIFELPRETMEYAQEAAALQHEELRLHIENLTFFYQRRVAVLEKLNLDIQHGDMVAIIGPSGSGKTTLFRILLGLLQPTDGTAELIGGDLHVPLSPSTRNLFAYVPQDNVIFSGSIADTLRLVRPGASDDELYAALEVACATEFVNSLPNGIYSTVFERGSSLSVGQNQRLAIARAVLADAPILLLDEVTSALDLETEKTVLQNIAALPNKTCIISTHRPSVLTLCSHIYAIRKHRMQLLSKTEYEELIASSENTFIH